MGEEMKARNSRDRDRREDHSGDIQLQLLEKDGEKLLAALNEGNIVAVLSQMEIMYVFIFRDAYQCFIHKMDAEEGRRKTWEINERNTAMLKNLTAVADQLFEIVPKPGMNLMGVMVAAERGIIAYLDATGQLPAEDQDFMSWQDAPENKDDKGAEHENL